SIIAERGASVKRGAAIRGRMSTAIDRLCRASGALRFAAGLSRRRAPGPQQNAKSLELAASDALNLLAGAHGGDAGPAERGVGADSEQQQQIAHGGHNDALVVALVDHEMAGALLAKVAPDLGQGHRV